MKRMELVADRSIEKEVITALRDNINEFYYSLLPQIPGNEKPNYKSKTDIWPNLHFLLISFLEDDEAYKAKIIISDFKQQFPDGGIKLFFMDAR